MSLRLTIALCVLATLTAGLKADAQMHFSYTARTGASATIGIPPTSNPNIGGIPLSAADEIGAFSPSGVCVGACIWTGMATTITVWGDDPMTPAIDGMIGGQHIMYRIWDASAACEFPAASASYSLGDGIYQPNGVFVLSSLASDGALPVELVSFTVSAVSGKAVLSWGTATELDNFGFDVERRVIGSAQWLKIGFVQGAGTANARHEYSYTDRNITAEKIMYRLKQIDRNGQFVYSAVAELTMHNAPEAFGLSQNYPNPFNPSTLISFDLPRESFVRLDVFDVLGLHVACLVNEVSPAGRHSAVFDATGLSSGIYFYRLDAGRFTQVKRMMFIR